MTGYSSTFGGCGGSIAGHPDAVADFMVGGSMADDRQAAVAVVVKGRSLDKSDQRGGTRLHFFHLHRTIAAFMMVVGSS
jgi:hypothetical protein